MSFIEEIKSGKLPPINKKTVIIVGGAFVALFVLFNVLRRKPYTEESSAPIVVADKGMPTNSADVQAQLQNFASMTEDYVNQSVNQAMQSMASEQTGFAQEVFAQNQQFQQQLNQSITKEFEGLTKEWGSRFEEFDKPVVTPNAPTTPTKPGSVAQAFSSFSTGTYKTAAEAQKVLSHMTSWGGTGGRIEKTEDGQWRAAATYQDADKAKRVGEQLKNKKLAGVYYVK